MKILKVKSRNYRGKSYFKYRVNVPESVLKEAGFKVGDEIDVEVKKGEIRLKKE